LPDPVGIPPTVIAEVRAIEAGKFDKRAYQKEYMRKRREAKRLKADKGTKK